MKKIKEDVNFLEYPIWVVSSKQSRNIFSQQKEDGNYEISCPEGLPTRFDKVVLYFLLHKYFQQENCLKVSTTRYEIAKNVLFQEKNFSQSKYNRIMLALKRWQSTYIRFESTFFNREDKNVSTYAAVKYFSILDSVVLNKETNELTATFNEHYMAQLKNSQFHRAVNFHEYKLLTRPVSARLYEILLKHLFIEKIWCVDIAELGEQLTLEKRSYPSHVIAAIKPAINDINLHTSIAFSFDYDKKRSLGIFSKKPNYV